MKFYQPPQVLTFLHLRDNKKYMNEEELKERIDEIIYEIEDFFDLRSRENCVYQYKDHKILAERVEKEINILFADIIRAKSTNLE